MLDTILFVLSIFIIAGIVGYYVFSKIVPMWREEDEEDEEFERRRQLRQEEFDRHAQAVARRVLIEQCENIYIGRTK